MSTRRKTNQGRARERDDELQQELRLELLLVPVEARPTRTPVHAVDAAIDELGDPRPEWVTLH